MGLGRPAQVRHGRALVLRAAGRREGMKAESRGPADHFRRSRPCQADRGVDLRELGGLSSDVRLDQRLRLPAIAWPMRQARREIRTPGLRPRHRGTLRAGTRRQINSRRGRAAMRQADTASGSSCLGNSVGTDSLRGNGSKASWHSPRLERLQASEELRLSFFEGL